MLVSPSGPTRAERLARGLELLESWGLRAVLGPNAYSRTHYLAGDDAVRAADLNLAFGDPEIRGVLCTRGGYGAQRVVDAIDMAAVRRDPKVVAGFSDITALQFALWRGARLAAVHGPGVAWNDERTPAASAESLRSALMSTDPVVVEAVPTEDTAGVRVPGIAAGPLLGGNLCLIAASIGTADMPDLTGAVLLVEEVQEPLYKIDRMLTHLRRAGVLAGLAGVALGQFTDCSDDWGTGLTAMLLDRLGDLGVPVLGGLPIGHGPGQLSVPVGALATVDATAGRLTVEAAVG
ncbi:LD-carboxypeptidase [Asanoa sp. WMMD1127]|uniref:S66 peptidase family protein n=1 Tax=Asanoa sp. WMMD1127 TaxID=3016107 RepID=UPI002415EA7C|nr:LD-carboxypeptidase [Asanoa sp. WMMD1127]MDG4827235.1 LD-carboxypeptidase [Asanoa sp. WMMD1127]